MVFRKNKKIFLKTKKSLQKKQEIDENLNSLRFRGTSFFNFRKFNRQERSVTGIYSKLFSEIVSKNPGFLKALSKMSASSQKERLSLSGQTINVFVDPQKRFKITRYTKHIDKNIHRNTSESYIIELKNPRKKLYLKENLFENYFFSVGFKNSISEHIALSILEKNGFNVIRPIASLFRKENQQSFILLDYTNKLTVYEAFNKGLISKKEKGLIESRLKKLQKEISKQTKLKIKDIFAGGSNEPAKNCLVDLSNKDNIKLFLIGAYAKEEPDKLFEKAKRGDFF